MHKLKAWCVDHNVPCITQGTEDYLVSYIQRTKPKYIFEIWSAVWYSALLMAQQMQDWHWNIWSVEHSFPDYQRACHNARKYNLHNVTFYHSDAKSIDYKKVCSQKMDVIYIDGRKADYSIYLERVIPIVAPHTTIIFDDVIKFAHKTISLYEFLDKKQINYQVLQVDPDDGILVIENAWEQLAKLI